MSAGLEGRVVVVTGASGDLGRAIVGTAIGHGVRVVAVGRESAPPGVELFVRADLRKKEDIAAMGREVQEKCGGADAFVHVAGINRPAMAARLPGEAWDEMMAVNLTAALACAQALLPGMLGRRAGSMVFVSSAAAQHPLSGQAAYAASKGGLESLARALAKELAPRGIRVNAVAPGMIESRMTAAMPGELAVETKKQIPLGRWGSPHEVAETVMFLLGGRASYITGQVVTLDGGWGM